MKEWFDIESLLNVIRSESDDNSAMHLKCILIDAIDATTKKGQEAIRKLQLVMQERSRALECKKREDEDRADERERTRLQGSAPKLYINSQLDYGTRNLHQLHD
ncbi:MAG: hypothetical protein KBT27_11315 [Prevotellaceae bacterium]|nr:hypothetical protein [Candidatus Faecinaster equi]